MRDRQRAESTTFEGTPSDAAPDILATGRTDVTTVFVSMSARHPEGRDAEYLRWHTLDHRPEQHRLTGLRGSFRLVSTPECRSARAAADGRFDAADHVMTYLFNDRVALDRFFALGKALGAAGRMSIALPRVDISVYELAGTVAAARAVVGADVVPWRPSLGAYVLIEEGSADAGDLAGVDGVIGAWWGTSASDEGASTQITFCFLDDDPVSSADRLRPVLEKRWGDGATAPLFAAPFHSVVPYAWERYLP